MAARTVKTGKSSIFQCQPR